MDALHFGVHVGGVGLTLAFEFRVLSASALTSIVEGARMA